MGNLTLFDPTPEPAPGPRTIRIRSLRAVFKWETVREGAPAWVTKKVQSSAGVFELFRDLVDESKEAFVALHLDAKNQIICFDTVSVGSLSASIVHPREVYKAVLLSSAAAVIFLHNHPSGDPTPSREDIEITRRLKDAGDLLGIRVLDHVIIGRESYYSFVDAGNF